MCSFQAEMGDASRKIDGLVVGGLNSPDIGDNRGVVVR